jgi:hypothetical protein
MCDHCNFGQHITLLELGNKQDFFQRHQRQKLFNMCDNEAGRQGRYISDDE